MAAYRASQKEATRLYAREATFFVQTLEGPGHRVHYECAPGGGYED